MRLLLQLQLLKHGRPVPALAALAALLERHWSAAPKADHLAAPYQLVLIACLEPVIVARGVWTPAALQQLINSLADTTCRWRGHNAKIERHGTEEALLPSRCDRRSWLLAADDGQVQSIRATHGSWAVLVCDGLQRRTALICAESHTAAAPRAPAPWPSAQGCAGWRLEAGCTLSRRAPATPAVPTSRRLGRM